MTTNDERLRILTLVQEGKINTSQATQMLQDLEADQTLSGALQAPDQRQSNRLFRIVKKDILSGKTIVEVSIPVSLVQAGKRIGANFGPELNLMNQDQIDQLLGNPAEQKIAESDDEEKGEHTEIFLV